MKAPDYLNWIELSRSALRNNIRSLKKLAGKRRLSVCVKANAYGHGLNEIVNELIPLADVSCLTVHSLDEAMACREVGWEKNLIVLGPIPHAEIDAVIEYELEPVIFDRRTLTLLGRLGDRTGHAIRTHLKLETGTNRQGVGQKDLSAFAAIYKRHRSLGRPYGASTHFANIEDTTNHEYAQEQLRRYRDSVAELRKLGIPPRVRHTACSAALILFNKTRFNLVRPGIAAYGHWPSKETYLSYRLQGGGNSLFRPVLTWKSRITQIKDLPAGSFVGYGCTYRTTTRSRLAVLPVGYADGYDRGLSNLAHVLVRGRRAPVRGRICMNLLMVDVTHIKDARLRDEAVLIGRDKSESLSAEQLAQWAQTINYEILSRISPSLPRIVI